MLDKNAYQLQIQGLTDPELFQEMKRLIIATSKESNYASQSSVDLCYQECLRRKKLQLFSKAQRAAAFFSTD